ncbi:Peroxisome-assembly ATPase [Theileria orientalis]|uniref:Peroxisome-assembly ATPase n=1 Tax=Theileria orientalis TaxID=68886 RepID=A0A976SKR9_THEOR|nr:Peroxisome-assembly ATPase [Theileria orientalis]
MIGITRLYRFHKNVSVKLTESQQLLREKLDKLTKELSVTPGENKGSFSFFKKRKEVERKSPKGVYIYGGVGQGKTMIMDMFYENVKTTKHRIHFHEFMIQVQKKLHENRNSSGSAVSPLSGVCSEIADEYKLLCLDEFHVTHISDAMILKELFTNLFKMGLVLVCTSNRAPEELYKNGLNRDRFLPFIPVLYKYCEIFNLNSEDFRQKIVSQSTRLDKQLFFLGRNIEYFLEEYARENEISKEEIKPMKLQVTPLRSIMIERTHDKVAFFEFSDFSSTKKGAVGTDSFIEMSNNFHTLYVSKVPQFDTNVQNNNQLKIFIQLIDILYEKNMKLILSTEKPIIFIFGLFGIVKLFDEFYNNFKEEGAMLDSNASIKMEDFTQIASKYKMNSSDATKLFNSMLLPNEDTLSTQRLYNTVKTYSDLRRGEITKEFTLFKFDT